MVTREGRAPYYCASLMLLLAACLSSVLFRTGAGRIQGQDVPLTVSPKVFDFGEVNRGTLTGSVTLTNVSDSPVQILNTMASCNCHQVTVPRKALLPREAVTCEFAWDVRSSLGKSQTSFKVVYKLAESAAMRHVSCTCVADVIGPYVFRPNEFAFCGSQKSRQTAVVKFESERDDFTIRGVACLHPAFSAACGAENREVIVTFDPDKWQSSDDYYRHRVRVRTSIGPEDACLIPIRVR